MLVLDLYRFQQVECRRYSLVVSLPMTIFIVQNETPCRGYKTSLNSLKLYEVEPLAL